MVEKPQDDSKTDRLVIRIVPSTSEQEGWREEEAVSSDGVVEE
jgi:hypothetical protein